ncbi:MAG: exodeoxyribonuclease VII large subunit, partial [Rhodanobacteraceae bacterium]
AEVLLPDGEALQRTLTQHAARLVHALRRRLHANSQRLDHAFARLNAQRPQQRLAAGRERLSLLHTRLLRAEQFAWAATQARLARLFARMSLLHPSRHLPARRREVDALQRRLLAAWARDAERDARRVGSLARALNAVSPLEVLQRGYAILFDAQGRVLRSAQDVAPGTPLTARLADGELPLRVRDPNTAD